MVDSRLSHARIQIAREHTAVLKGLLRIRRTTSKKLRTHSRRKKLFFWLRLGDAHSALRGWRPIPAALLSHSVVLCSGTEDIPSNYQTAFAVPPPEAQNYP
jgi:hypothetical protein